jgi:hypothetical protein
MSNVTLHAFAAAHNLSVDALRKAVKLGRLPKVLTEADYTAYRSGVVKRFIDRRNHG